MTSAVLAPLGRIGALLQRHWWLVTESWPRLVDVFYWPIVNIAIWGFIQTNLNETATGIAVVLSAVIGGVLLWDLAWRSQLGLALSIFEEVWSRNLGNLLVSPLRPIELLAASMVVSFLKAMIAVIPAAILAALAFGFNVLELGPGLVLLILALVIFAWSLSLVAAGLVVRFGQGAENMAWAAMFGVAPFAAVYYPIAALPDFIEPIARAIPASHVFEGLRSIMLKGRLDLGSMAWAFGLNAIWLGGGVWAFLALLAGARRRGMLMKIGE